MESKLRQKQIQRYTEARLQIQAFRYTEGRSKESMLLAKVISKCLLYSDPIDTNVPLTNGQSLP